MATYAIERDGKIVLHVVFIGEGLYRPHDIVPLTFKTERDAQQVADVLNGTVVDYDAYLQEDVKLAA